jgi:hypothetical protein
VLDTSTHAGSEEQPGDAFFVDAHDYDEEMKVVIVLLHAQ